MAASSISTSSPTCGTIPDSQLDATAQSPPTETVEGQTVEGQTLLRFLPWLMTPPMLLVREDPEWGMSS